MPITLTVTPADELIDVQRQIRVSGLPPGSLVTLDSRTRRAGGVIWSSQATFFTAEDGTVDTGRDAPVAGDYAEISSMGLVWAQYPEEPSQNFMLEDVLQPLVTEIRALTPGGEIAEAELVQRFAAPGVGRREVREAGLTATLFTPATPGPHPLIIVLNGSTGGINEARCALYASHGYQALGLGYFKVPGRSPYITNTPLEYFETALDWSREHLEPSHGFIALSGQSRGGELSLLLASRHPEQIRAVIAYVPGAMVHGAQGAADPEQGGWCGPAWTEGGQPLPHLWQDNRAVHWHPWDGAEPPHRHHSVFLTGLTDTETAARARIPVENIQAPVLLISGRDDRAWPSSLYSRMVVHTLRQTGHGHPVVHLDYDNAGHSINFPYLPTTQIERRHPVSGVPFSSGGTPGGNAHADAGSWHGVLDFLAQVRGPGSRTETFHRKGAVR